MEAGVRRDGILVATIAYSAPQDLYFRSFWWEKKVIRAGQMAVEKVPPPDTTAYIFKTWVPL